MHKRLIEEGFNRRYVLLPLLLSIALVVLGYSITEVRRAQARELADTLRQRQDVIRLLAEIGSNVLEAESAQRGFVLTGEPQYLAPMDAGLESAYERLDEVQAHYERLEPASLEVLDDIRTNLDAKVEEMQQSVAFQKEDFRRAALAVVKSDIGLDKMRAISDALDTLRERQRGLILEGIDKWTTATRLNTLINTGNLAFTIIILLILGLLATRDIRRRTIFASELATQIESRTAELRDLSRHMSRVSESEKYALSRELHDELGGLLVAMRMDLAQIRKHLGPQDDPVLGARWERVNQAISQGLQLKRRVIEDLRPTLLDNMGLFTALQWLASQRSEQAQLKLETEGLEEDVELPPETAIAVFRTAQEAIANVVRHSGATTLKMKAEVGQRLTIWIIDDGRGMPPDAEGRTGSHGLKQMRFRMDAVNGEISMGSNEPSGTVIRLSVPMQKV